MMLSSPFITHAPWTFKEIYGSLLQFFVNEKYNYYEQEGNELLLGEDVLAKLETDSDFCEFWKIIQEQHPERKEYFASLKDNLHDFNPSWIEYQYWKYSKPMVFGRLSDERKSELKKELSDLREKAYNVALQGEALRLNCNISDIRRECVRLSSVLGPTEEFGLADLPKNLSGRIIRCLDSVDIFRMTLVCKSWKSLIYENTDQLKRAEHAFTTHILTFPDWTIQSSCRTKAEVEHEYKLFSWNLIRWYCNISEGLETLVLDHSISYRSLIPVLQSCPKLKHLQIGDGGSTNYSNIGIEDIWPDSVALELPNLEIYCSSAVPFYTGDKVVTKLHQHVLIFSKSLKAYRSSLFWEDLSLIRDSCPLKDVFSKLIALDLISYGPSVLETLSEIDELQLKYLRIDEVDPEADEIGIITDEKARAALCKLLTKLTQLEVLIVSTLPGVTNTMIQLLTDLKLNLSFVAFDEAELLPDEDEEEDEDLQYSSYGSNRRHKFDTDVLSAFQEMLISKKPDLDLSNFHFILKQKEAVESRQTEFPKFTFLHALSHFLPIRVEAQLNHPKMKRRLGIDF